MRILLFGARGFLGGFLSPILEQDGKNTVMCSHVRLEDGLELERELDAFHPTHVVSCTGRTHGPGHNTIDYLEGGRDKLAVNLRDNLQGPIQLALACAMRNIHCTLISTGCIYLSRYDAEGHALDSFKEYDKPNFFGSAYSVVKGFTDQIMSTPLLAKHVLSLRIRLPIMSFKNPRNTLTKILSYKKICSLDNSVTDSSLFQLYLLPLMKQRIVGPLNFCNPGTVSHRFIVETYLKLQDADHECTFITPEELGKMLPAERSQNMLDTSRLETLFPDVLTAEEAVEQAIRVYE